MNKKGFTLIELLGVIIILAALLLIIIPPISNSLREGGALSSEIQKDNIILAARDWASDNKNSLPDDGSSIDVPLGDLQDEGYIEKDLVDPDTEEEIDSDTTCVQITNQGGSYYYEYKNNCTPSRNIYTITYDGNSGTVTGETTSKHYNGDSVTLSKRASKPGYTFLGWNTDRDATSALDEYTMPSNNVTLYAIYRKTVVITYNSDSNVSSISKTKDSCTMYNRNTTCSVTLPNIEANKGYDVIGWYNGNDKVGDGGTEITVSDSMTLTARTEARTYLVTYDYRTNGGTASTVTEASFHYGDNIDLTPVATKAGWTFVGWNTNRNAHEGLDKLVMDDDNVTLYAIYRKEAITLTAGFDGNGASLDGDTTASCVLEEVYNNDVQDTSCTVTPPKVNREDWTFIGFNPDPNGTTNDDSYNDEKLTLTEDNTNQIWYAITRKDFKAIFTVQDEDAATASSPSVMCSIYNKQTSCNITAPTLTAKDGYTVIGWNTNKDAITSSLAPGANTTLISDIIYYSITRTTAALTATFEPNGATISSNNESCFRYNGSNTCDVIAPNITRPTFNIRGWNTLKDATQANINPGDTITLSNNGTYYAITDKTVTFTFEKGDHVTNIGDTEASCTIRNSATSCGVTLPTITTENGYSQDGWYNGDDKVGDPGDTYEITDDVILTAHSKLNYYTVTYNYQANGGSDVTQTTATVGFGETVDLSVRATKAGWTFVGWNTNRNATTALSSYNMPASNVTLYAIYSKTLTATFVANGANIDATSKSCTMYNTDTSCGVVSPNITRNTFTITGWNTNANATSASIKSGGNITLSADATYYAITSKTITFTFTRGANVSSIGSNSAQCTIRNSATNCSVTLPSITANTGYTVAGWSTTNGATTGIAVGTSVSASDNVTYYANAIDITIPTVTLNPNSQSTYNSGGVSVTATLADNGSGIASSQRVYYAWSTSNTVAPSFSSYVTSTNTAGAKSTTVTIPASASSNLTGTYYLWIRSGVSDVAGNTSNQVVSGAFRFDNDNPTATISGTSTTNSITAVGNASAISGITKYEFSIDGNNWVNVGTNRTHTFTGLKNNTDYTIYVRVTSGTGKQATASTVVRTKNIPVPIFSETGTTNKTVTITYPSGCSSPYVCTYVKDDGSSVRVNSSTVDVPFTNNGTIVAYVTDGTNTVSSTYNVTVGRTVTYNYDYNGGTSASTTSAIVNQGSSISLTPTATKAGYTFVGWNTNVDATSGLTSLTMGNSNVTLYAIFRKDITATFTVQDTNAATANASSRSCSAYNRNTSCTITAPTLTARNGYTVIGWNTNRNATTSSLDSGAPVTLSQNTTYYSITRTSAVLTATFNRNGATSIGSSSLSCNRYNGASSCTVTAPSITRSGFIIVGWNTSSSATTSSANVGSSITLTKDVTYYAITSKTITVSFSKGTGVTAIGATSKTCAIRNSATNCSVTLPSITVSSGYSVIGWSTNRNATTGTAANTNVNVSANTTYYALAKDTQKPTCTISITSGTQGMNGWYTSNVGITLNRSDNVGVTSYGLTTSSSATYNGTSTATISSDGKYTYRGYVRDAAGNTGTCSLSVNKDSTPPYLSSEWAAVDEPNISYRWRVYAVINDNLSGVDTGGQSGTDYYWANTQHRYCYVGTSCGSNPAKDCNNAYDWIDREWAYVDTQSITADGLSATLSANFSTECGRYREVVIWFRLHDNAGNWMDPIEIHHVYGY